MPIPRLHRPTPTQFIEELLLPERPAVLTGVLDDWPALERWDLAYLVERIGERRVSVCSSASGHFAFDPERGARFGVELLAFRSFAERIQGAPFTSEAVHFIQAVPLPEQLPALLDDVRPLPYVAAPHCEVNLWMGQGNNVTHLHYDGMPNLLAQVRGRKRLVLFPPSDLPSLYHCPLDARGPGTYYSLADPRLADLERFPRLAEAHREEVDLEPGDVLFMPAFWWHHVHSFGLNISVNHWWSEAPPEVYAAARRALADLYRAQAALPVSWRRQLGRLCANFFPRPED